MSCRFLLAADIGATNSRARLSVLDDSNAVATSVETRGSSGTASEIKEFIRRFVRQNLPASEPGLRAAVIGLPGKISTDRRSCAISYLAPDRYVSFDDLFADLGAELGMLRNDLECGVQGIALTSDEQLLLLSGEAISAERREQRLVLGMPGTGLGLGLGLGAGRSVPSEGGHLLAALDPDDQTEGQIGRFIVRREQPEGPSIPTYENLLRGRAIPQIFESLVEQRPDVGGRGVLAELASLAPAERPLAVEAWALERHAAARDQARETFRVYGRLLGRLMQSMALAVLPDAVYLGGALVLATHTLFAESFVDAFQCSPVHGELLERLPVYVVSNPHLNLDGATHEAARLWRHAQTSSRASTKA
ncbi:MAG: hypothetical protein GY719_05060 [bacterium]|nr:hypothetical protein [bacterium]